MPLETTTPRGAHLGAYTPSHTGPSDEATGVDPRDSVGDRVPCPECGVRIADRHCPSCGERRPTPGDLSLGGLAAELVEQLAAFDFKLARTLVTLVRRPGQLTADFVRGRRGRYTRPLSLYLFVSGMFFVLAPQLSGGLGDAAKTYVEVAPTSPFAHVFDGIARDEGTTRAAIAERVRASSLSTSRAASTLLVPALAVALALLTATRRRLAVEHALLAIHLQTFLLIVTAVLFGGNRLVGRTAHVVWNALRLPAVSADAAASVLAPAMLLAVGAWVLHHLHAALRRVYGVGWWGAAWRVPALLLVVPLALFYGRFALVYTAARFHVP